MRICDECRDPSKPTFYVNIIVDKDDNGANSNKKRKTRRIINIPMELCDPCLTKVMQNLGRLKARGELGGKKSADPIQTVAPGVSVLQVPGPSGEGRPPIRSTDVRNGFREQGSESV